MEYGLDINNGNYQWADTRTVDGDDIDDCGCGDAAADADIDDCGCDDDAASDFAESGWVSDFMQRQIGQFN